MNLRDIAESAAVLAWYGCRKEPCSEATIAAASTEFYKTSLLLFQLWQQVDIDIVPTGTAEDHFQEVATSELLTRVFAALLYEYEASQSSLSVGRVALRCLEEHAEIRNACLERLASTPGHLGLLLRCERLHRKVQRWTDLLVSRFVRTDAALQAAFDEDRCLEFGDDWLFETSPQSQLASQHLFFSALQLAIPRREIVSNRDCRIHQERMLQALGCLSDLEQTVLHLPNANIWRMISGGASGTGFVNSDKKPVQPS